MQVYNLISDVLGQLFGLAHGGEVEGVKYDSLDMFLLYTSPVEIRCTLLGLMRTNLCASWAQLVIGSQNSCFLLGGSNTYFLHQIQIKS